MAHHIVAALLICAGIGHSMTESEFRAAYAKGREKLDSLFTQYQLEGATRYRRSPPTPDQIEEVFLARDGDRAVVRTKRTDGSENLTVVRLWDREKSFSMVDKGRGYVLNDVGCYSDIEDALAFELIGLAPFGHYLFANVRAMLADPQVRITRIDGGEDEVAVHWEKPEVDPEFGRVVVTGTWRFDPRRRWAFLGSLVDIPAASAYLGTSFEYDETLGPLRGRYFTRDKQSGIETPKTETEVTRFDFSVPNQEIFTLAHYGIELTPRSWSRAVVIILAISLGSLFTLYAVRRVLRRRKFA